MDVSPAGGGDVQVDDVAPSTYPNTYTYESATSVHIQAVAKTGYEFVSWSGSLGVNSNPADAVIDCAKTLTANFSTVGTPVPSPEPQAARSFPDTVSGGEEFQVTVQCSDYGTFGLITETLPDGFSYVDSSLDAQQVRANGQNVDFILIGETGFTYKVKASSTSGAYTFAGILKDVDKGEHLLGGAQEVTIAGGTVAYKGHGVNPGVWAGIGIGVVLIAGLPLLRIRRRRS